MARNISLQLQFKRMPMVMKSRMWGSCWEGIHTQLSLLLLELKAHGRKQDPKGHRKQFHGQILIIAPRSVLMSKSSEKTGMFSLGKQQKIILGEQRWILQQLPGVLYADQ